MVKDLAKLEKQVKQLKTKKSKESSKDILSKLSKPLSNRAILKSQKQITVKIPDRKVENVFEDENRFFKGNFEKEKRSMFLS